MNQLEINYLLASEVITDEQKAVLKKFKEISNTTFEFRTPDLVIHNSHVVIESNGTIRIR